MKRKDSIEHYNEWKDFPIKDIPSLDISNDIKRIYYEESRIFWTMVINPLYMRLNRVKKFEFVGNNLSAEEAVKQITVECEKRNILYDERLDLIRNHGKK